MSLSDVRTLDEAKDVIRALEAQIKDMLDPEDLTIFGARTNTRGDHAAILRMLYRAFPKVVSSQQLVTMMEARREISGRPDVDSPLRVLSMQIHVLRKKLRDEFGDTVLIPRVQGGPGPHHYSLTPEGHALIRSRLER